VQLPHLARAFLDRNKVLRGLQHRIEELAAHRDAHAAGVVVEHDGQIGCAIDGQRVHGVFLLCGQRVGRRADQDRIGLDGLCRFRVFDGILGADRAGADDERQTRADHFSRPDAQIETLLHALRVVLAGRAADDAVDPGRDQRFEHIGKCRLVDWPFRVQGRDGGGVDAFKLHDVLPGRETGVRTKRAPPPGGRRHTGGTYQ